MDMATCTLRASASRMAISGCSTRLQFAPRFRCADVAAEVAFLAMDFEHYGRADLAWSFVDAYVQRSGIQSLLSAAGFLCLLPRIRARQGAQLPPGTDPGCADEPRLVADADAYFDLAWAHAGGFTQPSLLVSMGLPASGKTTLPGARESARHGASLIRRGSQRDRRRAPDGTPAHSFRQGLYDPAMTQRTYATLRDTLHDGYAAVARSSWTRHMGAPVNVHSCSAWHDDSGLIYA